MTLRRTVSDAVMGVATLLAGALLLVACGGTAAAHVRPTPPGHIRPLETSAVPPTIGGLQVVREDVTTTVAASGPAYVDAVAMYSLKAGPSLTATLEVSRFNRGSQFRTAAFQSGIVNRIGNTTPRQYRLGHDVVYFTTGARQNLAVWFRHQYLVILSVKQDYGDSRALLRQALEIGL